MLIERVFPQTVGSTASLQETLAAEARNVGIAIEQVNRFISALPPPIASAQCFFDRLTNIWRYEYGLPRRLSGNQLLWGTHMWVPVGVLLKVLQLAFARLSPSQRHNYFQRLANPEKHGDVLAEFVPVARLLDTIPADFEFGTGVGGFNVEWQIRPVGARPVLVDVKNRIRDLLESMDRLVAGERDPDGSVPAPRHDASLLFRSVQKKFPACDLDDRLQGAWILTELKQETAELSRAFNALDPARVHFAVLGSWEPGIAVLCRRPADRNYLLQLFGERNDDRFSFTRVTG